MANGNKRKKVVKGGTNMSNKPDYEGINFKNKDIDRISSRLRISNGTRRFLAKRTTHVPPMPSTGKVLAKRTTHVPD